MLKRTKAKLEPQDLAAEIVRRARMANGGDRLPYVIHLSEPPTAAERLMLTACRLAQQPIVLVPGKCLTIDEWLQRYAQP